ncbi:ribosome maturation factor RimM [Macrococcus equipercicus]|uniref:Ribosome maturation factor RimM n=1 Tax=Macrococcus equipercicus TaxID=69967 RepID=A0A9Q9BWJ2_9STAP|nr:ribosome maturation factor RimM [Macrococcus equipercicus]KAA1036944.1 ribosome maturation factor RimM [Macrococcus equipercicus]UTH14657.1 ribosome maturation factor RimM [Macrococcus equipercicus]
MKVNVGKIVNMHGIKGEVRVLSESDFTKERFQPGHELIIQSGKEETVVKIKSYRTHKNFHLLTFDGLLNINAVEQYKGADVFQELEEVEIALAEHEYYYHDIIGCTVFNEGEPIGRVTDIFETGANDVWVVKGDKEHLIPYIADVVKKVDVDNKTIEIEAMDGLLS